MSFHFQHIYILIPSNYWNKQINKWIIELLNDGYGGMGEEAFEQFKRYVE